MLVRPCFKLLRDEIALPSAVTGPFDFAPLARAISALFDIRVSLI